MFHSPPRLEPEVFGNPSLLQSRFLDKLRNRSDPFGFTERQKETVRIGQISMPLPRRYQGNDDFRIGPSWIGYQDAKLDSVGENSDALTGGEQDPLCDSEMAEAVRRAALGGRVQVLVEFRRPNPKFQVTGGTDQAVAAFFPAFASFDLRRILDAGETHSLH